MSRNDASLPPPIIAHEVLSSLADGLSVHDREFRIIYQNRALKNLVGDRLGERCHEVYQQRNSRCEDCPVAACFADGDVHSSERVLSVEGAKVCLENIASPIRDCHGRVVAAVEVMRDVTRRKNAEENLLRISNLYDALSRTNKALMYCRDREALFPEICQVAVEHGKFCLAVIAVIDPVTGTVAPVAASGRALDYLESLRVSIDAEREEGRGPTGLAIREGIAYICNDFIHDPATAHWRDAALANGIRASAAFPLKQGDMTVGVLKVYSEQQDFFDDRRVELLLEMAENISFALENYEREEQRERAEEALRESEERLKLVLEGSSDGFWDFNIRTATISFSNRFTGMLGYDHGEVEPTVTGVAKLVHPDDRPRLRKLFAEDLPICDGTTEMEIRMLTKHGDWAWVLFRGKVVARDPGGTPLRIAGTSTDITERKIYEENLQHLSTHDALTGLFNRAYFDSELARVELGRHYPVSVVVADVDGLKHVNDTFGHSEGDRLIKKAAQALYETFRAEDVVARVGGDEFAVLLPGTDSQGVRETVARLEQHLKLLDDPEAGYTLSISVGSATAERREQLNEAMKLADSRMYYAKFQRKSELEK